jgi:hypothetical protein
MSVDDDRSPERLDFPPNWDVIRETPDDEEALGDDPVAPTPSSSTPPTIALLAASWADAVSSLAVCTSALLALVAVGHQGSTSVFPWAAVLGAAWWLVAASTLILIRQGTPGMLLAGVVFRDRVAPRRVIVVVAAAALHAVLLGLPGLLGSRRSPVALAAASPLEVVPTP